MPAHVPTLADSISTRSLTVEEPALRVLVGLELGGASWTERDQHASGAGGIGDVCWGPPQLLRDLELRLGLAAPSSPNVVRIARYAARIAKTAAQGRYYTRSFELDPLGAAAALLRLRDLLVEAGWRGERILDGGARLDALRELEQVNEPPLPPGDADRVAAIAQELGRRRIAPLYGELSLVEPLDHWSTCWQLIFKALADAGTQLSLTQPVAPSAPESTDLGRLQRVLCAPTPRPVELRGDGSFRILRAATAWEAARAAAAIVGRLPAEEAVIIREHDRSALDHAFAVAGLRTQGLRAFSACRSALQVLPLALELAFEPKDPYRVLELLTLPLGPFNGFVGHALARALAQAPGIGSPAWEAVKQRLPEREQSGAGSAEQLARIAEWLEAPGAHASTGAPIASLVAVAERVRSWLISRIQSSAGDSLLLAAAQQAAAVRAALESDPRASLTLAQLRRLTETVLAQGVAADLVRERAGRAHFVDSAAQLRSPCAALLWWPFTAAPRLAAELPWRRAEAAALAAANVRFPDAGQRLTQRAAAARVAFCCAQRQLVLVIPRRGAGTALAHNPLWDELVAGAHLDETTLGRVTVDASELRDPGCAKLGADSPALIAFDAAALPGGYAEWSIAPEHVKPVERFSPESLLALLGCPLQWALRYGAGVRRGGHGLPPLYVLAGTLGHRLVELLHVAGAFDLDDAALELRAKAELGTLLQREGGVLLRAGMSLERAQLERELVRAVVELARLLREHGLRIAAVEREIEAAWQGSKLEGRLDLLVVGRDGQHAIIDLKTGVSKYREQLRTGRALQLAAYAFASAAQLGVEEWPEAGYFSLRKAKLYGLTARTLAPAEVIVGPSLQDTWRKVERSTRRALSLMQQGTFPATGVREAAPLLERLGVSEAEAEAHFALPSGVRCEYCRYDGLCGRRWEALQ